MPNLSFLRYVSQLLRTTKYRKCIYTLALGSGVSPSRCCIEGLICLDKGYEPALCNFIQPNFPFKRPSEKFFGFNIRSSYKSIYMLTSDHYKKMGLEYPEFDKQVVFQAASEIGYLPKCKQLTACDKVFSLDSLNDLTELDFKELSELVIQIAGIYYA